MNKSNVRTILILVTCLVSLNSLIFAQSKPVAHAPSTRAGTTTQPFAQGSDPGDPQGMRMDGVFYEALYYFMTGDATRAFRQLDEAIDSQRPTDNWYLYLPLYQRCPEVRGYTARGEDLVKGIKAMKVKKVTTFVKLAVLLQKGPNPPSIEPQLRAILENHPRSLWSPWAKWKLIELRAYQLTREVRRKGFSVGTNHMLARRIGGAIQSDPELKTDRIMWKWMHGKLHFSSVSAMVHAEDCLKARYAIPRRRSPKGTPTTQPIVWQRPSREHWKPYLGPEWKLREYSTLRVIRGLHFSPKTTPEEEVWKYFEHLRGTGVALPRIIPDDKETFLEEVRKKRAENARRRNSAKATKKPSTMKPGSSRPSR